ncbi:hypothetical protein LUZ60_016729 [Juncus effusus]|nr:hypothetical protein LUZ60_016729 [Juncus effusus]
MNGSKISNIIMEKFQRFAYRGKKRGDKGHFVVYSKGGRRFVVPLKYLEQPIFRVLLEMAEEELGTDGSGPLTMPCEEELMVHLVSLLGVCESSK